MAPRAPHALATPAGHVQTEDQRQVAAERAILARPVRQCMALAPPDRCLDTPLAHERTVALVALCASLRAEVEDRLGRPGLAACLACLPGVGGSCRAPHARPLKALPWESDHRMLRRRSCEMRVTTQSAYAPQQCLYFLPRPQGHG